HADALKHLTTVERECPPLAGWSLVGQGLIALREKRYAAAHDILDRALVQRPKDDKVFKGAVLHARGAVHHHEGRPELARVELFEALELYGKDHLATGRVLDTIGMIFDADGHF